MVVYSPSLATLTWLGITFIELITTCRIIYLFIYCLCPPEISPV